MNIELKCGEDQVTIEKSLRIIAGYYGDKEGVFPDRIIDDIIKPVVASGKWSEEIIQESGINNEFLKGLFIIDRKTGDLIKGIGVELSEGRLLSTESNHQCILLLKPGFSLTQIASKGTKFLKYVILFFIVGIVGWGIISISKNATSDYKKTGEFNEKTLPTDTLPTYDIDIKDCLLNDGYLGINVKPSDIVKFYIAYSPEDGSHIRWEEVTDTLLVGMEKLYPKNNCIIFVYATDRHDRRKTCRKVYEFNFCQFVEQLIKTGKHRETERALLQNLKVIDYGNNIEDEGQAVNLDVLVSALEDYHIGEIVYDDEVNWQSEIRYPTYSAINTIKLKAK